MVGCASLRRYLFFSSQLLVDIGDSKEKGVGERGSWPGLVIGQLFCGASTDSIVAHAHKRFPAGPCSGSLPRPQRTLPSDWSFETLTALS